MIDKIRHSFEINHDQCLGSMECMRICPTEAIRVRAGIMEFKTDRCIDCGFCIHSCPSGTFIPKTDTLSVINEYDYTIGIVSPVLYSQFDMETTIEEIVFGLESLGISEVYDGRVEVELVTKAISDFIDEHEGPWPLISTVCPVVVRLVQVMYPHLVNQIIPIDTPRDIMAREAKKRISLEKDIPIEKIGAIYFTPCPGKASAVLSPAEGVESYIDHAIGITTIYNELQSAIEQNRKNGRFVLSGKRKAYINRTAIGWVVAGGQSAALKQTDYLSVAELDNVTDIFDQIEMGKIKDIRFLEAYACVGGCAGGSLTVKNVYIAATKLNKLASMMPDSDPYIQSEVERRYVKGDYGIRNPLKPRPLPENLLDISERIKILKNSDEILGLLPKIDCGICGSPTCKAFAMDVALGEVSVDDCFLLSDNGIEKLRSYFRSLR